MPYKKRIKIGWIEINPIPVFCIVECEETGERLVVAVVLVVEGVDGVKVRVNFSRKASSTNTCRPAAWRRPFKSVVVD